MVVVQYCAEHNEDLPKLAEYLDVGVMSISKFADEIIMELIRYAYDKQMEKGSIISHLLQNDICIYEKSGFSLKILPKKA